MTLTRAIGKILVGPVLARAVVVVLVGVEVVWLGVLVGLLGVAALEG